MNTSQTVNQRVFSAYRF